MKSVCLTVEQLQLFLQGLPDEQTVEQIADHLESCPDCARRLAEIDIDTQPATELSTQDALPFVDESECEHLAGELARTRPNHLPFIDAPTESMQLSSIDDYIIERRLGRGGMGTVYLARQANLGTKVAVKFVRSDRKQTPEAIRRFEREILSIGKLNHPNIVGAIDAGEWDGQPYLVMDYIEGIDLSRWIQSTGPLEPDVAMEIVRQIASALEVIHKSGRIHRDVKLSNVMVDRNGSVKLLDLGLTREISPDPFDETRSIDPETSGDLDLNSSQPLTRSGQVVGTLEYLAPEQFQQGAAAHSAIDIYGLGVTAFYLLTGRYPKSPSAQRSSSGSAQRSSGGSDESILELRPDLPNEVAGLISSALALDPKDRPTANEISRSISQRVQASELALKVIQLTGNPIERAHRSGRSATLILNVAVGFIVATMLSVCAWLIVTSKGPPTEAQPRTAQVQQSVTDGPSGSQSTTSPPAAPVNPSNDSFNKVDLAALVEPTRDSRYGNWSRENGQLVSKIDASNFLRIPYRLPDFYKFEIVAKRVSRSESLRIFLHTGGTRFSVMFDGWPKDGFLSGIEQLDGYRLNYRRKHRCVGKVLPDEKSFKIEIDVKEHPAGVSIDVSIDGKQITSWAGNPERIAQVSTVNEFQFGTPGLLVFENTSFVVDEISVTPSVEGGRVVDLGDVNMWLEWKGFKTQYESDEQAQEPKLVAVDATSSGGMTGDALSKLDEHESLRTISIGNCEVDHEQLNRMRLPNLQEMNLSNCSFDPGQFPKLERLVAKASSLRVDDIAFLHRFKSLLYLDLSVTPIRDLRTIVLPSSLERLELSGTALTGDDLKHMPPMPQLLDLDLNHTRVDHIDGLTRARFPMLRHIELLDSELTIDDHRELVSRFPDATITTGFGAIELISEVNPFQRLDLSEDSVSQYVPLERAEPLRLSLRVPQEFELTLSGDHKVGSKLLLSVPLEGVGMTTIEIDNARKTAVCGKNRPDLPTTPATPSNVDPRTLSWKEIYKAYAPANLKRLAMASPAELKPEIKVSVRRDGDTLRLTVSGPSGVMVEQSFPVDKFRIDDSPKGFTLSTDKGIFLLRSMKLKSYEQPFGAASRPVDFADYDHDVMNSILGSRGAFRIYARNQRSRKYFGTFGGDFEWVSNAMQRTPHRVDTASWFLPSQRLSSSDYEKLGRLRYLRVLDLPTGISIGDEAGSLGESNSIEFVNASHSGLSRSAIASFARLSRLTTLKMANCGIGSSDLEPLRKHPGITELVIDGIDLDQACLETISTLPNLSTLSLRNTSLAGCSFLPLRKCRKLRSLDISHCGVLSSEQLMQLNYLLKLQRLNASNNVLEAGAGLALASLGELRELNLSQTSLQDETIQELSLLPNLTSLNVSGTNIKLDSLSAFTAYPSLQTLRLGQNSQIDDAAVTVLVGLKKLRVLSLDSTAMSVDGAFSLQKLIPLCRVQYFAVPSGSRYTQRLDLRSSRVSDETLSWALNEDDVRLLYLSGEEISDASNDAIRTHPELTQLTLERTRHSKNVVDPIHQDLYYLHLIEIQNLGDDFAKRLADLESLKVLVLDRCDYFGKGLEILGARKLNWLVIRNKKLDLATIETDIVPMQKIRLLSIAEARLDDKALRFLDKIIVGWELCLLDMPMIEGHGLHHLPRSSEIRLLDLSGCSISDEGLKSIAGRRSLRSLRLNATKVTADALETIKTLEGLRFLELADVRLTDAEKNLFKEALPRVEIQFERQRDI